MRKFVTTLLTLWLMQMFMATVYPQEGRSGFASLRLSVESEKPWITLGDPVTLKVRLTNPTQGNIATWPVLDPGHGAIQVYISRNGGEPKRYEGPGWGIKEQSIGVAQISPGESMSCEITVLFNNTIDGRDDLLEDSIPINEAGAYQIRVELYDANFNRKISAPVIGIPVGYPMGEAEQAAWQTVKDDKDLAYFTQTGDGQRANGVVEKAEQLVKRYPNNNQERQLALALGKHYLERDNVGAAIGYLKDAAASDTGSLMRARALAELTESYLQNGDVDEALKISEAAGSEYPDKDNQQEFDRLNLKIRQARESKQLKEKPLPQ